MPFQNTPEDVETGSFADSTVDTSRTVEEWITAEVDGEKKAFGFILIPPENIPYRIKSENIQKAAEKSRGQGFNAMEYYLSMLEYQIEETSFGAEDRIRTWLTGASADLVEQLEEFVPDPLDLGDEGVAEVGLDLVEEFAETEGSYDSDLETFRAWLKSRAGGDEGKLDR